MKSIQSYLIESKSLPTNTIPLGKLEWHLLSKDYDMDEVIKCDGWNASLVKFYGETNYDGEQILVFWSPKSDWMIYSFVEVLRKNKKDWGLVSLDVRESDIPKVLANFHNHCLEHATIPNVDYISIPKAAEKVINDIKKGDSEMNIKQMKSYTVHLPYTTYMDITVNAYDAKEALEKAEDEAIYSKYEKQLIDNLSDHGRPRILNNETNREEKP